MFEEECQSIKHESSQSHLMQGKADWAESQLGNSSNGEADFPVIWYHSESSEPVTRVETVLLKIGDIEGSKSQASKPSNLDILQCTGYPILLAQTILFPSRKILLQMGQWRNTFISVINWYYINIYFKKLYIRLKITEAITIMECPVS